MSNRFDLSKVITILVLFIAAAGILYAVFTFDNQEETAVLKVGQPAPDFTLETVDGEKMSLSDFKGQVVMLNVWASWCEPCRLEMPELQEAYEKHKEDGFVILGVNLVENEVTVRGFLKNYGLTFPVVLDPDRSVAVGKYKVKPLPTSFFIDKDGVLQAVAERPLSVRDIENYITPLLSE